MNKAPPQAIIRHTDEPCVAIELISDDVTSRNVGSPQIDHALDVLRSKLPCGPSRGARRRKHTKKAKKGGKKHKKTRKH